MVTSFKLAKTGKRYRPQALPVEQFPDELPPKPPETKIHYNKVNFMERGAPQEDVSFPSDHFEWSRRENDASFSLNLYPDGFCIGKPIEGLLLPLLEDVPKLLHPYDRASMSFFSALEGGCLPGDILDDIPAKYFNGTLVCEVWDYRNCMPKSGKSDPSDEFPKFQKLQLRLGTENVVKDMMSLADDSWSYHDLLKAESQIIKALQPVLNLAPKISLDRLYAAPTSRQLDLAINNWRLAIRQKVALEDKKNSAYIPDTHGSSTLRDKSCLASGDGPVSSSSSSQSMSINPPHTVQNYSGSNELKQAFSPALEQGNSAIDLVAVNTVKSAIEAVTDTDYKFRGSMSLGKNFYGSARYRERNRTNAQFQTSRISKRPRQVHVAVSHTHVNQNGSAFECNVQREVKQLCSKPGARNVQALRTESLNPETKKPEAKLGEHPSVEVKRCIALGQKYVQPNVQNKLVEMESLPLLEFKSKTGHSPGVNCKKSSKQQQVPSVGCSVVLRNQTTSASGQMPHAKRGVSRKRKLSHDPQISIESQNAREDLAYAAVAKLNTVKSNILETPCSACPTFSVPRLSKDDVQATPANAANFTTVKSSPVLKKYKSNSAVLLSQMSEFNHPATTISTYNALISSDALVGLCPMQYLSRSGSIDSIIERFSKLKAVVERHSVDNAEIKCKNFLEYLPGKDNNLAWNSTSTCLSPSDHLLTYGDKNEVIPLTDLVCMSQYVLDGSRNTCRTRRLSFARQRFYLMTNGKTFNVVDHVKLLLLESHQLSDHKVAVEVIFGSGEEQHIDLTVLPSLHKADLLAAQFASLMNRDNYTLVEDHCEGIPLSADPLNNLAHANYNLPGQKPISGPSLEISNLGVESTHVPRPSVAFSRKSVPFTNVLVHNPNFPRPPSEVASFFTSQRSLLHNWNNIMGNQAHNGMSYLEFLHTQQQQQQYQYLILQQALLQQSLWHHWQLQLGSFEQNGPEFSSQMSPHTPTSPLLLFSESMSQQASSRIGDVWSPELSIQTAVSGSNMCSRMDKQSTPRGRDFSKDAFFR